MSGPSANVGRYQKMLADMGHCWPILAHEHLQPEEAERANGGKPAWVGGGERPEGAADQRHCRISAQSQALVSSGARDLQQTPRANCVVSYRKNETKVSPLDGKVACELSKHLYGVDQWWVLLKHKA